MTDNIEEIKEKGEKKQSIWNQIDTSTKVLGIAIIMIAIFLMRLRGLDIQSNWVIIAGIVLILFILAKGKEVETLHFTPEEAMDLEEDHLNVLKLNGRRGFDFDDDIQVGPEVGLRKHKAIGQEYVIRVSVRKKSGLEQEYMGIVNYTPPANPTVIRANWIIRGDEKPSTRTLVDEQLILAKKYGTAFTRFLR